MEIAVATAVAAAEAIHIHVTALRKIPTAKLRVFEHRVLTLYTY